MLVFKNTPFSGLLHTYNVRRGKKRFFKNQQIEEKIRLRIHITISGKSALARQPPRFHTRCHLIIWHFLFLTRFLGL